MSSETFIYNLDVLRSKENQLKAVSKNLLDINSSLKNLNGMIDNYWKGIASQEFKNKNIDTMNRISEIQEDIELTKSDLTAAIDKYKSNEDRNETLVDELSIDNIF